MMDSSTTPATRLTERNNPQLINQLVQRLADYAPQSDVEGAFPENEFQWLADAGLLAITLPDQELDFNQPQTGELLQLLKRIGSGNLSVGRLYEGHLNALLLIHLFGTTEQQKRYYTDVIDHQRLFSVWNTQADDGVRIHAVGAGRYVLKGAKTFCSGAGWIQRPLITGELIGADRTGWQMCIVPTESVKAIPQDARFWQPLGMRSSASFKLDFTGIEVDEHDLLGEPGDYLRQPYFSGGAIRFAAVQLGAAEALVNETRTYLKNLNRISDPFQQARVSEMACLVESGNQWLTSAGNKTDAWLARNAEADKIVAYANMTRTAIEQICLRTLELAERSVGARGLMRPLPFERIHRDLSMYLRQPAPDAALTQTGHYVLQNLSRIHDLWH